MAMPYPTEDEIIQTQMQRLLKHIEMTQSEAVIESIFCQLGRECFRARRFGDWLETYRQDVLAFLEWVNVQQASKYWERLEFGEDGKTLILTGRKVHQCACRFAESPDPPLALCHYCCKEFQQAFFGKLLGGEVVVKITAAFLLGDERCSTEIQLVGDQESCRRIDV
jgi:hypothetical protein